MSNLQEMKLNLLTNKSLLFYKIPRPYLLFEKKSLYTLNRKNFKKLKSSKDSLENFLSIENNFRASPHHIWKILIK